jgi:hypothetical protein
MPLAVVLPSTTEEVSAVMRYCHEQGVKVVPRPSCATAALMARLVMPAWTRAARFPKSTSSTRVISR